MNSLVVAGIAVFLLFLGYVFYSPKVKEWIGLDDSRITPAVEEVPIRLLARRHRQ